MAAGHLALLYQVANASAGGYDERVALPVGWLEGLRSVRFILALLSMLAFERLLLTTPVLRSLVEICIISGHRFNPESLPEAL